jgi:hypothetical protein
VSYAQLGERLVAALPPAFLLLVLLNCGFLGFAAWSVIGCRDVSLARHPLTQRHRLRAVADR